MKFSIRFADQIVGALIILAIGIVIFVIFMLGSSQRWFSQDNYYYTYFPSASGLSQNMAVQYKGFTIGRVKSIRLDERDQVEVRFSIFDTYTDRVKQGSLVEIITSPIGALGGNQFVFHPGMGTELLDDGKIIYAVGSAEAKKLQESGLAQRPEKDDIISNIINSVGIGTTIATLNDILTDVQEALEGTDKAKPLGKTMTDIDELMNNFKPAIDNIKVFSDSLADPDNALVKVFDSEGKVYTDLTASLGAISTTLKNLEKTSSFIPAQLPQVAVVLNDVHSNLQILEGVLTALTTNPLLKQGVPERNETKTGGSQTRKLEFE
jgi:phospholipid/cholesterol/gamma-HCH transport system substrate-binding protein